MSAPAEGARVTAFVAVGPAEAFHVFTGETDLWWRRTPRHRFGGDRVGVVSFEGGASGRLVETFADGEVFEVGKVLAWEPGARLLFEWRAWGLDPHESTEVEVRFEPVPGGTRVTLEHRGWEAVRRDHPARRGLEGEAFTSMLGLFWGELATSLRACAARPKGPSGWGSPLLRTRKGCTS